MICEVVDRGPADTGLRHFLFVVPTFAVLAGIGFDGLLSALATRRRMLAAGAAAAIVAALAWDAGTLVRLHPYQYLFYNPLVGGLEGAQRRYVTDYWVNIMPEAVDDLEAYIATLDPAEPGRRYTVAVCGERLAVREGGRAAPAYGSRTGSKADFFIAPTHMNCDRVLDGKVIATHRAHGRLDRRGQGPPRAGAAARQRTDIAAQNAMRPPGRGPDGRWIRPREGMFAGVRIARPMRGVGRSVIWSNGLPCRTVGGRPVEAVFRAGDFAFDAAAAGGGLAGALAKSSVGSSQNRAEKASRTSALVMPISASMWRSSPARTRASRRWRRACARILEPAGHQGEQRERGAQHGGDPARGRTGTLAVMAVSLKFAVRALSFARRPRAETPEIPTRIPCGRTGICAPPID